MLVITLAHFCFKGGEGSGDEDRIGAQFQYVLVVGNKRYIFTLKGSFNDVTFLATQLPLYTEGAVLAEGGGGGGDVHLESVTF